MPRKITEMKPLDYDRREMGTPIVPTDLGRIGGRPDPFSPESIAKGREASNIREVYPESPEIDLTGYTRAVPTSGYQLGPEQATGPRVADGLSIREILPYGEGVPFPASFGFTDDLETDDLEGDLDEALPSTAAMAKNTRDTPEERAYSKAEMDYAVQMGQEFAQYGVHGAPAPGAPAERMYSKAELDYAAQLAGEFAQYGVSGAPAPGATDERNSLLDEAMNPQMEAAPPTQQIQAPSSYDPSRIEPSERRYRNQRGEKGAY